MVCPTPLFQRGAGGFALNRPGSSCTERIRAAPRDKETEKVFKREHSGKVLKVIQEAALRKLVMLHAAAFLEDLNSPPGNRLEALKGDRRGQHSIRINDQYRICFVWSEGKAHEVEIVDYHKG